MFAMLRRMQRRLYLVFLHVKSGHEGALRATAPGGEGPMSSLRCIARTRRCIARDACTHRIAAKRTVVFDTDSARIQPGGGPASPVNRMAVRDAVLSLDMNSSD